ncbi:type II toxin-antitoxin system RelB/DinJ family antitoxin [Aureimonas sp. D3]|uniref:type II toxin-antitoxin system RelB/DinJ family antitoxin n=1 Tax=Aureimonas sp. D3 TaxID=1638164 RepID=UPI0007801DE7|nr:type II toxin-antitoxin system RelB/DinJ family antitoxin [Aureimonas sp. D3]
MPATTTITTRIDETVKKNAAEALEAMGLTLSSAVNIFLTRVAHDRAIPFDIRVPNATTRAAMAEADEIASRRAARFSNANEMMDALETGRE